MRTTLISFAFGLVLAISGAATAQDKVGPNGGLLGGKEGHETELVVTSSELTVYLIEDGKVESTKGARLSAVVQDAGKSTTVKLADVENKKLVGKLAGPLGKDAIVVLSGKDDHGHTITARYLLK